MGNDLAISAFTLLQTTVEDLHRRGFSRLGATLKPELQRRSRQHFDERQLGFQRFQDFLRSAEAAGFIRLVPAGPDLEAYPPELSIPSEPKQSSTLPASSSGAYLNSDTEYKHVRPDLWRAFTSYDERWVFDRRTGRAIPLSMEPKALEPADSTALRARLKAADDVVEIPESLPQVLSWMKEFTDAQTGGAKDALSLALGGEKPHFGFNQVINAFPRVKREWQRFRLKKVLESISQWQERNKIVVNHLVTGKAELVASRDRSPKVDSRLTDKVDASTRNLGAQIDTLIDELLKLRGILSFSERH